MNRIVNHIKNLPLPLKCSLVYIFSSILVKGLSFLTMPLFTRLLSTAEMGIITTFSSWHTILFAIVSLSLGSASYNVAMVEFKEERNQYDSSILCLTTLSCLCFFVLYFTNYQYWNSLFGLPLHLMIIMFCGFLFTPATSFWMIRQRYEFKYKPLLYISVLSALLSTGSAIAFVLFEKNYGSLDLGSAKIVGKLVPEYFIGGILYIFILIKGKKFYSLKYWAFSLKLSLPLIIHTLSKHILDTSDRIMIDYFCGKSEVGIYGVLYTVSSLSLIIWSAINASLIPVMFEKLKVNQVNEINKIIKQLILIYGVFASILSLFSPEIVSIMATEEYYSAIYIMPPIASGIFLTSLYTIFGNLLTYYKKTNLIMVSTLIAATINFVLNFYYIPLYKSIAASYTTLIAYICLSLFQYMAVRKVSGKNVIDNRFLIYSTVFTLGWCLICNILYKTTMIRYCVLAFIILISIYFRERIIKTVLPSRFVS